MKNKDKEQMKVSWTCVVILATIKGRNWIDVAIGKKAFLSEN